MPIDRETKKAIADRLTGWEIVDFLQISADEIIEVFEQEIEDNLIDVLDFADLREYNTDNDEDE